MYPHIKQGFRRWITLLVLKSAYLTHAKCRTAFGKNIETFDPLWQSKVTLCSQGFIMLPNNLTTVFLDFEKVDLYLRVAGIKYRLPLWRRNCLGVDLTSVPKIAHSVCALQGTSTPCRLCIDSRVIVTLIYWVNGTWMDGETRSAPVSLRTPFQNIFSKCINIPSLSNERLLFNIDGMYIFFSNYW